MNFFQRVPFRRFSTEERLSEPHNPVLQKSPPDGGWGWVVVLSSFIFNVLVLGFHNSFGVYLISFLETFKETSSKIAWVGSISYGLIMIFGPVSGKMTEKFGARIVSILGSILIIVSIVGSSYASKLDFLFLTHGVLTGIGSSFAFTPGMIMISQYFTTQRSLATGIVMSGGAAGALVQTRLHQYLIRTVGWRQSMRIFAGIMGISVMAGFAYKPLNPPGHSRSVVENLNTSPIKGFIVDLGLWKDRVFLIWVFANGLAKFGFFIPYVHLINHGVQLGIPFELATNIMLVLGMSSFISRIIFGRICNSSRINRLYINQGSVFTVGLLYLLIPFFKTFGSLIAFGLFLGIADAGNYILLPVLTFDLMGAERMAVAWGFMLTVNSISCYGPPFAGWMNDMYGSYNLGFIVAGALNVASVFVLALIPWAKRSSMQNRKSILSVSMNETTHEINPWIDNNTTEGPRAAQYVQYVSRTNFQQPELHMDSLATEQNERQSEDVSPNVSSTF